MPVITKGRKGLLKREDWRDFPKPCSNDQILVNDKRNGFEIVIWEKLIALKKLIQNACVNQEPEEESQTPVSGIRGAALCNSLCLGVLT